jgi:uncharacterized membrane protein (UPF0127 family)
MMTLAVATACGASGPSLPASPGVPASETVTLTFTNVEGETVELLVEIADTPEERARGLMFREQLPEDRGMLFVFEHDTTSGFWMKDTLIPLTVAFVAVDGRVIDIQDMEPLSEETHFPSGPYRYAVEANQGWFQRHQVLPGSRMQVPELER